MPDQFIKFPRVESIQYFESAMYGHNKVLRCKKISDSYYEIQREDLPPIFVFVSNYYALSVSDYYGVFTMSEFMGALNCAKPSVYIRPIDREDNDRAGVGFGRIG